MAQPIYYPLWAMEDTTLPNTDQTNKIRPKTTLRDIGWDKGQIPSAEEFNWLFNNMYQWIYYLNEEALPTYLPINGTSLSFTGDITGTATWSGNKETSVELSSQTLNSATSSPIINTLVKRDSSGGFSALQNMYGFAPNGLNFDYRIYDKDTDIQLGSYAYDRASDVIVLYKGTSTAQQNSVRLYSDRTEISKPRSSSSQGTNAADLTRKDYVDTLVSTLDEELSSDITDLNTNLTNYINGRSTASFSQNGWWKDVNTGMIIQWGLVNLPTINDAQTSASVTFPVTFPNNVYSITANTTVNNMNTSTGNIAILAATSATVGGFTLYADSNSGQDFSIIQPCYWIAIGR